MAWIDRAGMVLGTIYCVHACGLQVANRECQAYFAPGLCMAELAQAAPCSPPQPCSNVDVILAICSRWVPSSVSALNWVHCCCWLNHNLGSALQEVNNLLASVDELSAAQLGEALTKYGVKSPDTKNDISAPFPFNLMFKTSIGPKGDQVGYLRPETAQGLFVNFR